MAEEIILVGEKLFRDVLRHIPCMTSVCYPDGRRIVNREESPFFQDENYVNFLENGLPEDRTGWKEIFLSASDGKAFETFLYRAETPVLYLLSAPADRSYRVILGPFSLTASDNRLLHEYSRRHRFSLSVTDYIPVLSTFELMDEVCIIHEMSGERELYYDVSVQDLIGTETGTGKQQLIRSVQLTANTNTHHSTYEFEQAFEQAIISGDRARLEQLTGTFSAKEVGRMSSSSLKQTEYMTVALVTLLARAAIRAGMNEVLSYRLSDYYLQRISEEHSIPAYTQLCREITDTYMDEIRINRSGHVDSLHIERAKNYIRNHRNKNLTVSLVAHEIGINPSYLSSLFRQFEECSVKRFILQTKLEGAANMLRYSEYDITSIAEYFCFASPSHFAAKFREEYGCTPGDYRKKKELR